MSENEREGILLPADKYLFLQDGGHAVGHGDCQSSVGCSDEGVAAGSRPVRVIVYCHGVDCHASLVLLLLLLVVMMGTLARLKRLVQGLTLVAAAAYTSLLLYQNMSTVASSSSRLAPRQQVRNSCGSSNKMKTQISLPPRPVHGITFDIM